MRRLSAEKREGLSETSEPFPKYQYKGRNIDIEYRNVNSDIENDI